jgi:hypothetical protein
MVWGIFDEYIRAVFPAREQRAEVRRKGIQSLSDQDRSTILKYVIEQRLAMDKLARHHLFHPE